MSTAVQPLSTTAQREHFEALAREAERAMASSLSWYRVKIALLAGLGYAVIVGTLAVLLLIGSFCVWALLSGYLWVLLVKAKLLLAVPAIGFILMRALWVRIDAPTGRRMTKQDCPLLFEQLADLCCRMKAPRIHRVLIVNDANVSIAQIPRLGIFGWHRNYLVVGLPLLFMLSPEQVRAVLAHEIGHLSGNHSRFGAWIYRVRLSWFRIVTAFQHADSWASGLLARFFYWYAPYFSASSFALARANEYEADAAAASLTSPQAVGSALVAISTVPHFDAERYWDPFFKRADYDPQVPRTPWSDYAIYAAQRRLDQPDGRALVTQCLKRETNYADTHPSLADRLKALHAGAELVSTPKPLAAEAWLFPILPSLLTEFDRQWVQTHEEMWAQRSSQTQTLKATLTDLERKDPSSLSQDERWNVIAMKEHLDPTFDPLPAYRQYQADYPQDRAADLAIGRLLLSKQDRTGLQYLTRATEEFRLVGAACQIVGSYAMRIGDKPLAEEWTLRAEAHYDTQVATYRERATLSATDTLKPTNSSPEQLAQLQSQLRQVEQVHHAWMCEKATAVPTQPCYVLAVELEGFTGPSEQHDLMRTLTSHIRYPGETFVVLATGDGKSMADKVKGIGMQVI
ncbi:MAG: M48 family metallopeptidase [Nitrospira sp.]|nr:M48 family metallopeptidase [Nitrospira sp.]